MTDKQLKQLLTPTPKEDKEFVNKVMCQLPKTDLSWRPIWTIRIVTLIIALLILAWSQELTHLLSDIVLLAHGSWTTIFFAGIFIAGTTLYICHEKEIL